MNEVKAREDEYDLVKEISKGIEGLPSTTHLARRERRLLAHGLLDRLRNVAEGTTSPRGCSDTLPPVATSGQRLARAVLNRERALSQERYGSCDSLASNLSVEEADDAPSTASSFSSGPPTTPRSVRFNLSHMEEPKSMARLYGETEGQNAERRDDSPHDVSTVYMFIFTDLALLTLPVPKDGERNGRWKLCEDGAIFRIMGVTLLGDDRSTYLIRILPPDETKLYAYAQCRWIFSLYLSRILIPVSFQSMRPL